MSRSEGGKVQVWCLKGRQSGGKLVLVRYCWWSVMEDQCYDSLLPSPRIMLPISAQSISLRCLQSTWLFIQSYKKSLTKFFLYKCWYDFRMTLVYGHYCHFVLATTCLLPSRLPPSILCFTYKIISISYCNIYCIKTNLILIQSWNNYSEIGRLHWVVHGITYWQCITPLVLSNPRAAVAWGCAPPRSAPPPTQCPRFSS